MFPLNCSSIQPAAIFCPIFFPSQCKNGLFWFFIHPIFDSKANIWTTTHLFLGGSHWAVCSHFLNSEYLLEVYHRSFPHLSWPLVLSTFSSSSLYFQLPLVLFTIYLFLKSWFVFFFFFTSLKKFSSPPVLLVFSLGRWSFYFQLYGEDMQDPVLALMLSSSLHLVSG